MEKQKMQRIIGTLVIVAFVVILIPLFFGKTDVSTQVTSVKAPPLPGQQDASPALAKADIDQEQTPSDSAILGSAAPATNPSNDVTGSPVGSAADAAASQDAPQAAPVNTDGSAQPLANTEAPAVAGSAPVAANNAATPADNPLTADQSAASAKPAVLGESPDQAAVAQPSEMNASQETADALQDVKSNTVPKRDVFAGTSTRAEKKIKHRIITTEKKHGSKVKPVNLSNAEIEKLNKSAWAVQMGNFRDKENARRLTDKLREAGYKAFTKEIKSAQGSVSTRVYIGPEFKQASAVQLSDKVEQNMKLHGIVVAIKPLAM